MPSSLDLVKLTLAAYFTETKGTYTIIKTLEKPYQLRRGSRLTCLTGRPLRHQAQRCERQPWIGRSAQLKRRAKCRKNVKEISFFSDLRHRILFR